MQASEYELTEPHLLIWTNQIANALQYLHSRRVWRAIAGPHHAYRHAGLGIPLQTQCRMNIRGGCMLTAVGAFAGAALERRAALDLRQQRQR